jgi:hypothetical protein
MFWSSFNPWKETIVMSKRQSKQFWINLINVFENTEGVSQANFAKHHNVSVASFKYWLYKLRQQRNERPESMPVRFVELTIPQPASPSPSGGAMLEAGAFRMYFETLPELNWLADVMRQTRDNKPC